MTDVKRVLFIDNVVSPSGTNIRPREHREIDIILKSKKYAPYMVVSEPLIVKKPRLFLKTKSFNDSRVQIYRVPCLILGSLSSNRSLGKFGKLMFGLCNALFQCIYIVHLTLLVLTLAFVKRIDLLHAHNPPDLTGLVALILSRIKRIPYVFEVHDRAPELYCGEMGFSHSSLVYKLMKAIEHQVVINADGVITVNKRVAKYFSSFAGQTPVAIYTGTKLNINEFSNTAGDENRLLNKRLILYQGSLNMASIGEPAMYNLMLPLKTLPYILNNFPDVVLVYVGEGSGRRKLERTALSMGLKNKVIFTGFIEQKRVFDWISRAYIVLVPYADNPNCQTTVPTKLYEYMAFGKPIVATDFPGIAEIITNERNGLLYNVKSLSDFIKCLLRLLENFDLAQRLALNAKQDFFSKYSLEKNWPKLLLLYDSITN